MWASVFLCRDGTHPQCRSDAAHDHSHSLGDVWVAREGEESVTHPWHDVEVHLLSNGLQLSGHLHGIVQHGVQLTGLQRRAQVGSGGCVWRCGGVWWLWCCVVVHVTLIPKVITVCDLINVNVPFLKNERNEHFF